MSLKLGKSFIAALRTNTQLLVALGAKGNNHKGARLFTVARPESDEAEDKIPYIIIMPQGINTNGTKDDYEDEDTCTIGVLVVASEYATISNTPGLVELTEMVRRTIHDNLQGDESFSIDGYTFQASPVEFDANKPCYFQTLTYIVSTQNTDEDE